MNSYCARVCARSFFWTVVVFPTLTLGTLWYGWLSPSYSDAFASSSAIGTVALVGIIACLAVNYGISLLGMLVCGVPRLQNEQNIRLLREQGWSSEKSLIFCFVSQGIQQGVLKHSVAEAIRVAERYAVQFQVEIVVDTMVPSDNFFHEHECKVVSVPPGFTPPNGSRFKARALYYATLERNNRPVKCNNTWVVHCDEDTVLTDAAIAGIWKFIQHQDSSSACGAGEIKYNLTAPERPNVFSVADYYRTGEDLGRFRFQFSAFQAAFFGTHGSFLVVPVTIAERVQFDFGPQGSITEDIYFALKLHEMSVPYRKIDGYVREQSPMNWQNFLSQRARWVSGILNSGMDPRIPFINRALLLSYMATLRVTVVVACVPLLLLLFTGFEPCLVALWGLASTVIATNLLVGALRNIEEDCAETFLGKLIFLGGVLLVMPLVCFMETIALINGLLFRVDEFLVVQKTDMDKVGTHAG